MTDSSQTGMCRRAVPVRLVINADDLGISSEVNDAIFECINRGVVSSATLLANGPFAAQAAESAKYFPNASFGVHLNATEFAPLTTNKALLPILDPEGRFAGNLRDVSIDSRLRRALTAEWIAQIEHIRSLGVKVSHIDSHHHVHTAPQLFWVLKRVQRRCGIHKVRISKNIYSASRTPRSSGLLVFKRGWNWALRRIYPTTTTDGFTEFRTFVEVTPCHHATIELMTHPGDPSFDEETKLLSTDWQMRLPFRIAIINYDQL